MLILIWHSDKEYKTVKKIAALKKQSKRKE